VVCTLRRLHFAFGFLCTGGEYLLSLFLSLSPPPKLYHGFGKFGISHLWFSARASSSVALSSLDECCSEAWAAGYLVSARANCCSALRSPRYCPVPCVMVPNLFSQYPALAVDSKPSSSATWLCEVTAFSVRLWNE
jgi:hypothetical protein